MGLKRERSRWEIILDVLKATDEENKSRKTRIMHRAYLDWRNFERHFNFLIEEGFVIKCSAGHRRYRLTEKGKMLLKRLKEVYEILD